MPWPSKDALKAIEIHNSYDLARRFGGGAVYLAYRTQDLGRGGHPAAWQAVGVPSDIKEPWFNYGLKTFIVFSRQDKAAKLIEAVKWVKRKTGLDLTERDPWGNLQATGTKEKTITAVKEATSK